jgi:ornithine--oxo-acid transaminase
MVLPMNTGAEAVETAIKLARKWAHLKKKVPSGESIILSCTGNFHGRTMTAVSLSTEDEARIGFEPFLPGVGASCPETDKIVEYNDVDSLRKALEVHGERVAAFIVEPVQGEAGIVVPDEGYLKKCAELCKKHNVLLIADEIQSGLGRTGKLLACEHDGVRPDIVLLGKSLSGGCYPVSAVLTSGEVMLCIQPGEHGSTYGGNPVACAAALAALNVIIEEGLVEKSAEMGVYFREKLVGLKKKHPRILKQVRGLGLMNAIVLDEQGLPRNMSAFDVCMRMKDRGVLSKPTRMNIIRFTPPLCITKEEIDVCIEAVDSALTFE